MLHDAQLFTDDFTFFCTSYFLNIIHCSYWLKISFLDRDKFCRGLRSFNFQSCLRFWQLETFLQISTTVFQQYIFINTTRPINHVEGEKKPK